MWTNNEFMSKELQKLELCIRKSLKTRNKSVQQALIRFVDSGGKRLRPALTIMGGSFGEYDSDKIISSAAAIEIIHMATLIHDDIIDDAKLRRGSDTIHTVLGKDVAVYCGDFLFTRAFMLVSDHADNEMVKDIAKGMAFICDSEIAQNEQRYKRDVNLKMYLKRICGKTAALFALSLATGAHKAKCSMKMVRKLGVIGRNIGMAFQIVDDLLDFSGVQKTVGKPLHSDAMQGVYTLPIIYALSSSFKAETLDALDKLHLDGGSSLEKVLEISGAMDKSRKMAHRYIEKAKKSTMELPDTIGRTLILDLIDSQLDREF